MQQSWTCTPIATLLRGMRLQVRILYYQSYLIAGNQKRKKKSHKREQEQARQQKNIAAAAAILDFDEGCPKRISCYFQHMI